jgi:hypothetical protein
MAEYESRVEPERVMPGARLGLSTLDRYRTQQKRQAPADRNALVVWRYPVGRRDPAPGRAVRSP